MANAKKITMDEAEEMVDSVIKNKKDKNLSVKSTWSFYVVMAMLMIGIFAIEPNKGGIYSTYCAYYFVHTGEAYNYYKEYKQKCCGIRL